MHSFDMLPELQRLPAGDGEDHTSREMVEDLIRLDPISEAIELSIATYLAMWHVFDRVNVDDQLHADLLGAYQAQYPNVAAEHSLHDRFADMQENGTDSVEGFLSGIKGKLAEINIERQLEASGYSDVEIAASATQPVWDISALSPSGEPVLFQVKTGGEGYAGEVIERMAEHPEIDFAISSEIFSVIAARSPELIERMRDIGSDFRLVEGADDGLSALSDNLGIDVPDGLTQALPIATAILAGARLIYGAIQTERMFKDADRTTKNKIQVIQALALMSRIGVTTTMASLGAAGGSAIGSSAPLVGNLIGGLVGGGAGAGVGIYLNERLNPHILDLALDITGLDGDDLFYFKNKSRIDKRALSLRETAIQLRSGDG